MAAKQASKELYPDSLDPQDLAALFHAPSEPTASPPSPPQTTPPTNDAPVEIHLEDVTVRVEEVDQAAAAAAEVMQKIEAPAKETVAEYNERVKREFTHKVLEARRQAAAPPPPPQPVAPQIVAQTEREKAAGARQSAYWAEQQKHRPPPNARDIAAAGSTVAVFQPASYTHEKGVGIEGKQYTSTNLPGR